MVAYFNLTVILEWITFILAILLLDKKTTVWQLFIILLFLVLCTETLGWYMIVKLKKFNNALPFNLLMLTSTSFLLWFLKRAIPSKKARPWLAISIIGFALFGLGNLLFFQGIWTYDSISESIGDIIMSIFSCYFLISLVKDSQHVNLLKLDYFWLATGILFYSLGSAMLYQFSYLLSDYYRKTNINIGNYINYGLNLVLYTTIIIAFICRRKATR